jgi:hypothetical protein
MVNSFSSLNPLSAAKNEGLVILNGERPVMTECMSECVCVCVCPIARLAMTGL